MSELTDKQSLFVDHYVACLNGAEAARRAGYSDASARQIASENLSKPDIRAAIDARLAECVMPPSEILTRLSEHARGSMADFVSFKGRGVTLDLKKAALADKLHLVKRFSKTKQGVTIELYDSQAALVTLAKHYGLLSADDDDWRRALESMGHNASELFAQLVERLAPTPTEGAE